MTNATLEAINKAEAQAVELSKQAFAQELSREELTAQAVLFIRGNVHTYNDWKAYHATVRADTLKRAKARKLPEAYQAKQDAALAELEDSTAFANADSIEQKRLADECKAAVRTEFVQKMDKSIENQMGYWERVAAAQGWVKPSKEAAPVAVKIGAVSLTPAEVKKAESAARKVSPMEAPKVYEASLHAIAAAKAEKAAQSHQGKAPDVAESLKALAKSKNARIRAAAILFATQPERVAALLVGEDGKPSDLFLMA